MDDLFLVAGLSCLVYAAFRGDTVLGFVVLGLALIFLSFAMKDVKIPRPRLKLKARPWRS
jgi:hypothetical protein